MGVERKPAPHRLGQSEECFLEFVQAEIHTGTGFHCIAESGGAVRDVVGIEEGVVSGF
jgi:hypothetical protein